MKPVASPVTEVDNLQGEEVKFTISQEHASLVMRSTAELYSDLALAVVREYSTNARDANILAGNSNKPIEVTLPSEYNPKLTIRDYGPGMSKTELTTIYTEFGNSTKRDSDLFNGLYGFGSKAGAAYGTSFTVASIQNGRKIVAVITRKEDDKGGYDIRLKIVLEMDTTEDNGITIEVPVHNIGHMVRVANNFYSYWPEGTVLVNGRVPLRVNGTFIDRNIMHRPVSGESVVVMGNVPYPFKRIDECLPKEWSLNGSLVIYVENGKVEFTPSREDLKYSTHTMDNLKAALQNVFVSATKALQVDIDACPNHWSAYEKWSAWKSDIFSSAPPLVYKGDSPGSTFDIDGWDYHKYAATYRGKTTWKVDKWSMGDVSKTLFVTGFYNNNVGTSQRATVNRWKELKNESYSHVIFTDKLVNKWINPAQIVDWDTIKAEAPLPKRGGGGGGISKSQAKTFEIYRSATGLISWEHVTWADPFYVYSSEFKNKYTGNRLKNVISNLKFSGAVVIVPANRYNKFKKDNPGAVNIWEHLKTLVNLDGPSMVPADYAEKRRAMDSRWELMNHDHTKIDDPVLREMVKMARTGNFPTLPTEYQSHMSAARILGLTFVEYNVKLPTYRPSEHYPLWQRTGNDHFYWYLNTYYNYKQNKKTN